MNPFQTFRVAVRALVRNTMRSFLTTLGIVIGVAAVIAMVAIGDGAKAQVESSFAAMGSNLLIVLPGTTSAGGARGGFGTMPTLRARRPSGRQFSLVRRTFQPFPGSRQEMSPAFSQPIRGAPPPPWRHDGTARDVTSTVSRRSGNQTADRNPCFSSPTYPSRERTGAAKA